MSDREKSKIQNKFRYRKQWVILKKGDPPVENWLAFKLNHGRLLYAHPDTRIQKFKTIDGCNGFVVGICVDTINTEKNGACGSLNQTDSSIDCLRPVLRRLAGIYVIILDRADDIVLFTDPAKLAGVFYSKGRAASTPSLLPEIEKNQKLAEIYPLNNPGRWYPGKLTPWKDVYTPLANHAHLLASGNEERFWPINPLPNLTEKEGIEQLIYLLRKIFEGYLNSGPLLLSITGGKDSRFNLSVARPWIEKVEFFTVISPETADCDIKIPEILSTKFFLNHKFLTIENQNPSMLAFYDQVSAEMSTGPRRNVIEAISHLAKSDFIHLNGVLGAVFKTYYWPCPGSRLPKWNAKLLYREFPYFLPEILKNEISGWEASVKHLPLALRYNLMYCELRAAKWMSPGETASKIIYDSVTLQSSREVLELFSALPHSVQYGQRAFDSMIRTMWAELLTVPYCYSSRKWSKLLPKIMVDIGRRVLNR